MMEYQETTNENIPPLIFGADEYEAKIAERKMSDLFVNCCGPNIYEMRPGMRKENIKARKRTAAVAREFIVKQKFNGTVKLSEIFADLLYADYCRNGQKNNI